MKYANNLNTGALIRVLYLGESIMLVLSGGECEPMFPIKNQNIASVPLNLERQVYKCTSDFQIGFTN